jgi:RNA 2',3'-cyclic 3'-phosphodiesterase
VRLFVAVELSDEMRKAAARAAETIRRTIGRSIDARWVEPEKMHLTVRFIGHVHDDRVPDLLKVLAAPLSIAPFEIALGGCGAFPPRGGIRVIWIGLETGLQSLTAMHDEYNRRLAPVGFEPEDRPYSAHLTLARVKGVRKGPPAALRETIRRVAVQPSHCRVDRVTIFRSNMSSKGSSYEPLAQAIFATERTDEN